MQKTSHIDFHAVDHEDAALPALPDLVAVEHLHLACALVVFVLDADASFPFLDFAFGSPQFDVDRLRAVEHEPGGRDMNAIHVFM